MFLETVKKNTDSNLDTFVRQHSKMFFLSKGTLHLKCRNINIYSSREWREGNRSQ